MDAATVVQKLGVQAREAAQNMRMASPHSKNKALTLAAAALRRERDEILAANARDLAQAEELALSEPIMDRLRLDANRVEAMAAGLVQIAALTDPVGEVSHLEHRPSGIQVGQMRVPLGVIGIIYESRPNVTADAAGLCLKSGNAVILRGGSEAIHCNRVVADCMRRAMMDAELPGNAVQLVDSTDRALVGELLKADSYLDVIIPRGGRSLIERVARESRIPVIKHLDGVCHIYVDAQADLDMACDIAVNAKTHRYGVCNAMETLLIHQRVAAAFVPMVAATMHHKGVELRGCAQTCALAQGIHAASEQDWGTEYLAPILALRVVENMDAAMRHIARYGSAHTDGIITADYASGQRFLRQVDSASVIWNASTRFADGFEYGLGAEIGISTDRLHVRGPVGLEGLTTRKWIVLGHGEVRR